MHKIVFKMLACNCVVKMHVQWFVLGNCLQGHLPCVVFIELHAIIRAYLHILEKKHFRCMSRANFGTIV